MSERERTQVDELVELRVREVLATSEAYRLASEAEQPRIEREVRESVRLSFIEMTGP